MLTAQATMAVRASEGSPWLQWLPLLAVWLAGTTYVMAGLPAVPVQVPDSISYIEIAANRPPAYGWMLRGLAGPDWSGRTTPGCPWSRPP